MRDLHLQVFCFAAVTPVTKTQPLNIIITDRNAKARGNAHPKPVLLRRKVKGKPMVGGTVPSEESRAFVPAKQEQ
ncbi:MAG: hypothetical protein LBR73_03800 [Oscillospiraceae bacterium]|jgi:hypothetical protein|nr:hypothetical protein [Oscillospiraceae bacterium]